MIISQKVRDHRQQMLTILQQFPIRNPKIFGSVAKGIDTAESDIDLLVEPLPQMTMFDLCGLQIELEELLGVKVDVLTPRSLPEKFRQQVLSEAIPL